MFSMPIDDVFYIKGRGVVATGTIAEGSLRVGDQVWIGDRATVVDGIESFRKRRDEASVGDTIGVLFRSLTKAEVDPGAVLTGERGEDRGATFRL
ncbi:hypothetical protein A7U43_19775 [Mycobacterium adipatum]|uniref:Translation elongation factor EFTu-like domain-containing protein n=1 Tax=Mycobacterium adipatum TaxID=1682113 RepID=A0A172UR10_9MYCO|nr:EF-Tu/IF-2/RF-3 family GTPase [Mycobacterium adipatum]ANE81224.1 hypothetical protein A7U43_19775 [Mycobacterium adipatum]MBI5737447.1 elongation factor Tu [Mycolicibacterium neoaurum]